MDSSGTVSLALVATVCALTLTPLKAHLSSGIGFPPGQLLRLQTQRIRSHFKCDCYDRLYEDLKSKKLPLEIGMNAKMGHLQQIMKQKFDTVIYKSKVEHKKMITLFKDVSKITRTMNVQETLRKNVRRINRSSELLKKARKSLLNQSRQLQKLEAELKRRNSITNTMTSQARVRLYNNDAIPSEPAVPIITFQPAGHQFSPSEGRTSRVEGKRSRRRRREIHPQSFPFRGIFLENVDDWGRAREQKGKHEDWQGKEQRNESIFHPRVISDQRREYDVNPQNVKHIHRDTCGLDYAILINNQLNDALNHEWKFRSETTRESRMATTRELYMESTSMLLNELEVRLRWMEEWISKNDINWDVVRSGDTKLSEDLTQLSSNISLLIRWAGINDAEFPMTTLGKRVLTLQTQIEDKLNLQTARSKNLTRLMTSLGEEVDDIDEQINHTGPDSEHLDDLETRLAQLKTNVSDLDEKLNDVMKSLDEGATKGKRLQALKAELQISVDSQTKSLQQFQEKTDAANTTLQNWTSEEVTREDEGAVSGLASQQESVWKMMTRMSSVNIQLKKTLGENKRQVEEMKAQCSRTALETNSDSVVVQSNAVLLTPRSLNNPFRINFNKNFTSSPHVTASLSGLSLAANQTRWFSFRIRYINDVSTNGFVIFVDESRASNQSAFEWIQFEWLAIGY